ncbi:dephospho-CoA kinase [Cenarchaeum symbiosum A]|uniref:Dephospho-CoA kinase n=1 Tax=Cenarchaeum symbiosum (strain A) TaxID=414004 RepID=A0RYQ6_CENSY|nr:dephospho-CoA kinase [Cenarchaeum symbiosum A]
MPGVGKSTIAAGLAVMGYVTINMGDMVRKEAARRGIEPTGGNLGRLMLELREKGGPGAIAELIRPQIDAAGPGTAVIDGIRSNDEIEFLKGVGRVRILSIHASAGRRFGLLQGRGRPDDPREMRQLEERDARELGVGIGTSIALADESLSNNGLTAEQLVDRAVSIIQGWEEEDAA